MRHNNPLLFFILNIFAWKIPALEFSLAIDSISSRVGHKLDDLCGVINFCAGWFIYLFGRWEWNIAFAFDLSDAARFRVWNLHRCFPSIPMMNGNRLTQLTLNSGTVFQWESISRFFFQCWSIGSHFRAESSHLWPCSFRFSVSSSSSSPSSVSWLLFAHFVDAEAFLFLWCVYIVPIPLHFHFHFHFHYIWIISGDAGDAGDALVGPLLP